MVLSNQRVRQEQDLILPCLNARFGSQRLHELLDGDYPFVCPLLVVRPHPQHLDGAISLQYLIYQPKLNVDTS